MPMALWHRRRPQTALLRPTVTQMDATIFCQRPFLPRYRVVTSSRRQRLGTATWLLGRARRTPTATRPPKPTTFLEGPLLTPTSQTTPRTSATQATQPR